MSDYDEAWRKVTQAWLDEHKARRLAFELRMDKEWNDWVAKRIKRSRRRAGTRSRGGSK